MRALVQALLALVIVVASGLVASYWISSREEVQHAPVEILAPLVRVVAAVPERVPLSVSVYGSARPREEGTLAAQVGGRVVALAPGLVSGGRVQAGEVLVQLDRADLELARIEARARVAQAELALALEERQASVAAREWRSEGRGEPDSLVLREPHLAEARAELEAARARLDQAELDLERATVRAPFDARVREESVALGDWIAVGQPLATLISVDGIEVPLPLTDAQLSQLEPRLALTLLAGGAIPEQAQPRVSLEARLGGRTWRWSGSLERAEGEIDARSRMVTLIARVEQSFAGGGDEGEGPPLYPGLFVEASIEGRVLEEGVRLPRIALRGPGRVFVVDGEGRLDWREVQVAWQGREEVVLEGGLAAGERVCISPLAAPVEGMLVRVAPDEEP